MYYRQGVGVGGTSVCGGEMYNNIQITTLNILVWLLPSHHVRNVQKIKGGRKAKSRLRSSWYGNNSELALSVQGL